MSTPTSREKHPVVHSFFPISRPGDKQGFHSAKLQRHLSEVSQGVAGSSSTTAINSSQLRTRDAAQSTEDFYRPSKAVHEHTNCDVCLARNMTGVRFKCLECDGEFFWHRFSCTYKRSLTDFDICSTCMSSPTSRSIHNAHHSFWPIPEPGNTLAYWAARAQPLESKQAHTNVWCNSCTATISGVRHKCLVCEGTHDSRDNGFPLANSCCY